MAKCLIMSGGVALLGGLMMAFVSAQVGNRVMGDAALGVGVFAPDERSTEWRAKKRKRQIADRCFYVGLVLTALGVVLQTIGGVL
jgi:hypothetical protein